MMQAELPVGTAVTGPGSQCSGCRPKTEGAGFTLLRRWHSPGGKNLCVTSVTAQREDRCPPDAGSLGHTPGHSLI